MADRDLPPVQERRGRVVAQAERPAVQPRQEAGLRLRVPDRRQALGQQVGQQRPVLVQLVECRVQPRQPFGEGGHRCQDAEVRGDQRLPALLQERRPPVRAGDREAALEAGNVPPLRR